MNPKKRRKTYFTEFLTDEEVDVKAEVSTNDVSGDTVHTSG
jgi:hypothetical protein